LILQLKRRGFWIVGLDPRGDKLWSNNDFCRLTGLVLGGEQGLRELVRRRCDQLVRLPMAHPVDSLNVSVAAGVVLYEALRQRGGGG
jgi:23S rRNA (guanosine2251-2'-O)-methyltransferase